MKWNKKTIEQAEKELSDIERMPHNEVGVALEKFIKTYGIHQVPKPGRSINSSEWRKKVFDNAHTFLQTKMMLNACTSARSSCMWAAIAAIVAAIGVIASWSVFLHKMIFQILKGFLNRF